MKQVLQDLKTGSVIVADVPEPAPARGRLLVRVEASLLSAGTEGAQLAKGRQSLLAKVREKPQLIRQGLEELRERGLAGVKERLANKFEGYADSVTVVPARSSIVEMKKEVLPRAPWWPAPGREWRTMPNWLRCRCC